MMTRTTQGFFGFFPGRSADVMGGFGGKVFLATPARARTYGLDRRIHLLRLLSVSTTPSIRCPRASDVSPGVVCAFLSLLRFRPIFLARLLVSLAFFSRFTLKKTSPPDPTSLANRAYIKAEPQFLDPVSGTLIFFFFFPLPFPNYSPPKITTPRSQTHPHPFGI